MGKYIFGVDIGGTSSKIGIFDSEGNLLEKWEISTETNNQGRNVLKNAATSLKEKMQKRDITENEVIGIGIGLPGTKDKEGGFDCPNLNWRHVMAESEMCDLMGGIRVEALNDANAAALGEMWKGSAKGYRDVVMVTIGTGVGGGIILGGQLLNGVHGGAGEIGCIVVNSQEAEAIGSGSKGCLEQYASATGLVNMTRRRLERDHDPSVLDNMEMMTAKHIFDAGKSGDKLALEMISVFSRILGKGLAVVSCTIDPEIYVIGGGVSKAGEMLVTAIRKAFLEDVPDHCRMTKFVSASLGNDAGMYGAVYAVMESIG